MDIKSDTQLIEECKGYFNAMLEAMETLRGRNITVGFNVDNGAQGTPVKALAFVATKKLFEEMAPQPANPTQQVGGGPRQ